jgi:hypothetical protein
MPASIRTRRRCSPSMRRAPARFWAGSRCSRSTRH